MEKDKILKFAQKSIYDTVEHLGEWNGYEVWEPDFSDNEPRCIGFPEFILIKGDSIRWSKDSEESIEIMDKFYQDK